MAAPSLIRHEPLSRTTRLEMFPVMLLGPCVAAMVLTRVFDGPGGLRSLFSRMAVRVIPATWYAALLIPPVLVVSVLLCLQRFVSSAFAPNHFFVGVLFGLPAGFLEEIGWTGYALPKLRARSNGLVASIVLGIIWSLWHIPVIDNLGTVTPHGDSWLAFFFSFALAMTAIRVLIAWTWVNTQSLLLAQLMHLSSTASLVVFSPPQVTAAQEVRWYALYGAVLWLVVTIVVKIFGRQLERGGRGMQRPRS